MRKFKSSELVVATHNQGKLEEISALLEPYKIRLFSAKDLDLPEPEETEDNFVGNARIKAHSAVEHSGKPCLADDSGLSVDVLDGAPGVYTADWAETGSGRDFEMAMNKTWSEVQKKGATAPFSAQFRCTFVLAWPDGHDEVFEGVMPGQIVWPMRGDQGHGYDPIFKPNGYDITFGEMDRWKKNKISHRARAVEKLVTCFED